MIVYVVYATYDYDAGAIIIMVTTDKDQAIHAAESTASGDHTYIEMWNADEGLAIRALRRTWA